MTDKEILNAIREIVRGDDLDACEQIKQIKRVLSKERPEKPCFIGKEPGDHFFYRGIEWIFLGLEQDGALCVTAEPVGNVVFDKSGNNNWEKSSLREYLNTVFLAEIGGADALLTIQSDLVADNGDDEYGTAVDYVALLSCDLYRKYRNILPHHNAWFWTCTPWICDPTCASLVRGVDSYGGLSDYEARTAGGVVPACVFRVEQQSN